MLTTDDTSLEALPGASPPQEGSPPDAPDLGPLGEWASGDRGLLDGAVASVVAQNRAHAARLETVSRFHANRVAELEHRRSSAPAYFVLTPLQATVSEFAPLLGVSEFFIQLDLEVADGLKDWFPGLWRRCCDGRLDIGRARLALDQLAYLTSDTDKRAFAELVEEWIDKRDDPEAPLCPIRRSNFQTAVRRRCLKFPQRDDRQSFAEAYKKRRVRLRQDENGIAVLSATTAVHHALNADYRLTLIAKKLAQQDGESRTLEQLRVDALIDLIHGRLRVGATDGELEDDETGDGTDPATTFAHSDGVGAFARPIINVTVPISTLMGLSDEPGVMAGDVTVPAELVRDIALQPGATWHRLLTDAAGSFLELSTERYKPTAPMWRCTVARDRQCVWPECSRPATVVELDHLLAWPLGRTTLKNLQPLCRKHHLVKHSEGFSVVREDDGSYTWTSRFGSVFRTPAPEYPVGLRGQTAGTATKEVDASAVDGLGSVMEREFRTWLESSSDALSSTSPA